MRIWILLLCSAVTACGGAGAARAPLSISSAPSSSPPLSKGASLRVADAALAGGAPGMALNVAREVLAKHPDDAVAVVREADALFAMRRIPEATRVYQRALRMDPRNIEAKLGLGRTRIRTDPAGAEAMFLQVLAADPTNAAAMNDLGIARDLQGRHAAAQEAYTKAAALAPEMTAAQVNLGLSLALSGHGNRALEILRPLAANPEATPRVRQDLAVALMAAGDDQGARRVLGADMSEAQVADVLSGYARLRPSASTRTN